MTEKKSCAQSLIQAGLSVIKACMLTSLSPTTFHRKAQSWREKDRVVIDAIQAILAKNHRKPDFGNTIIDCDFKAITLSINEFIAFIVD